MITKVLRWDYNTKTNCEKINEVYLEYSSFSRTRTGVVLGSLELGSPAFEGSEDDGWLSLYLNTINATLATAELQFLLLSVYLCAMKAECYTEKQYCRRCDIFKLVGSKLIKDK